LTGLVREVADGPVIVAIDRGKVIHPDLGLGERRSEFPTRAAWEADRRAPEPTQRDAMAPLNASANGALGSAGRFFSLLIDTRERRSQRLGG
jgi:hypothetical protein